MAVLGRTPFLDKGLSTWFILRITGDKNKERYRDDNNSVTRGL